MAKWIGVVMMAALCAACGSSTSGLSDAGADSPGAPVAGSPDLDPAPPTAPPAPVVREIKVPSGTPLRLDLTTPVASDRSAVEDTVRATLRQAVQVDGATVLPAGTELTGTVTEAERSGRVKGLARVAYRFTSLRAGGERYSIQTAPVVHEATPTKKKDATKIAIGAGVGAAVGGLLGGGGGAAKGAAVGGAGGTGAVLATRGEEVRLGTGANVMTRLTAPLTVRLE